MMGSNIVMRRMRRGILCSRLMIIDDGLPHSMQEDEERYVAYGK
jgi:hypothetical protein